MNVLICPSHNYVMSSGIMLESLFTNNKSEAIQVYSIIDEDVTEDDKKTLDDIVQSHHAKPIIYRVFTKDIFNSFPNLESEQAKKAAYYRLFAATLLPNEVNKILYLDGDLIIMDSLRSLWDIDVDGVAVAGVMDQDQNFTQYNRLHYPRKFCYINSGVMLINLNYWRDNQVEKRFKDYIEKHPERIKWYDQDVINPVLKAEKRMLPLKYNVQHTFYFKPEYSLIDYWDLESEILDAVKCPVVLHYTCMIKPWYVECPHPKAQIFLDYKKKTIWADTPLLKTKRTWKQILFHGSRLLLELLHVLPRKAYVNKYIVIQ